MSEINSNKLWKNISGPIQNTIVLNKHFCFIQIPKTSRTNFMMNCKKKNLTQLLPCYRHEGLLFIEEYIYDKNLPIYTLVRNPFYHIHSYFFHQIRHNEIKIDQSISIVTNFENFCKSTYNNKHLIQCDYIKSNKNLKVNFFKLEEGVDKLNDHILKTHNINLNLNKTHYNKNPNKEIDIKSFFTNNEIVDLIIKARHKEFELFNYSTNINDI
jgi:hypothetical protein